MGVPRQEVGVDAIGDTVYAVGGFAGMRAQRRGRSVRHAQRPLDARSPRCRRACHHVVVVAAGGVLYAMGGLGAPTPSGASDATFAYDPAANAWTARAALPRPRGAGAAAMIDGLRLRRRRGLRGDASVRDLSVYDPPEPTPGPSSPRCRRRAITWPRAPSTVVSTPSAGATAAMLFDVVEVFDPRHRIVERWSRRRMPTARGGLGAAVLDGLLYAFGGEGNPDSPFGTFPQAEAYDPARDAWSRLPDMGVPRHGIGVAAVARRALRDGRCDSPGHSGRAAPARSSIPAPARCSRSAASRPSAADGSRSAAVWSRAGARRSRVDAGAARARRSHGGSRSRRQPRGVSRPASAGGSPGRPGRRRSGASTCASLRGGDLGDPPRRRGRRRCRVPASPRR